MVGSTGSPPFSSSPTFLPASLSYLSTPEKQPKQLELTPRPLRPVLCPALPSHVRVRHRGPAGVWTAQRAGRPLPQLGTSFVYAKPSLTHMALRGLVDAGKLSYVCSQNVDGLHLRSGLPRAQLAELHGNCFCEKCPK